MVQDLDRKQRFIMTVRARVAFARNIRRGQGSQTRPVHRVPAQHPDEATRRVREAQGQARHVVSPVARALPRNWRCAARRLTWSSVPNLAAGKPCRGCRENPDAQAGLDRVHQLVDGAESCGGGWRGGTRRRSDGHIGAVTSATLRKLGIPVTVEASVYTVPGLVDAILAASIIGG